MSNFIIEEFEYYKAFVYANHPEAGLRYGIQLDLLSEEYHVSLRFTEAKVKEASVEDLRGKKHIIVYFPVEVYPNLTHMIQYEEPLFFYYNFDNKESYITTSEEHVGDLHDDE